MTYEALRLFADSWGLVLMGVAFVGFVGWAFRPNSSAATHRAATSIFEEDQADG
ncbi:CcoQ/FixQ family Cbb3-type cytochrome c oxidase assembly chaperone [Sphingomonas mali]|jgi:cytochrome c oxidase cbb3-type subunit 4|uniref:CcoQ/FixQ family Cbb3-type cytochrome c oxidase assembly chaperone n=1 Tax=Sphingomonas mali TaxID=40682 RepID=UPI00082D0525|nr:CcoQ/FixQ family Cbb3-type cytochrome c oxidase assembly chaperone [Sphingomonas mali]